MDITRNNFGPNGCTIVLEDGHTISKARLVATNVGNNGGKGGRWSYYGSITIETEDGNNFTIDASTIRSLR